MAASPVGAAIASLLAGAWRPNPASAPLELNAELEVLIRALQRTGSAALAWPRIRGTALERHPAARIAHAELVFQSLRCAAYEQRIGYVFDVLKNAQIDALLMKGRAAAAYYAHPGLRPYGDIDVLVRPRDFARAQACLRAADPSAIDVDLHERSLDLAGRSFDDLYRRSRVLSLDGGDVHVPAPEDHLMLVALHCLRHCSVRPAWLCDIAAALEAADEHFDWDVCLGANGVYAKWLAAAISLARTLLGAHSPYLPDGLRHHHAPAWLVRETLREWSRASEIPNLPLLDFVHDPRHLAAALRRRWPERLRAAMYYGNPPDAFHLPYQCALFVTRGAGFCGRVARSALRA